MIYRELPNSCMEMGPQGLSYKYLPAGINNSFERSVKKGLERGEGREREGGRGGREKDKGSLQFIWKGSGKFKLLGILLLSVSLTVIKKCLNDLNNTWFSRQALIALYQAKRRWMLSRKPQVRQADSVLVWHGVPLYRPVFAGALPALYLAIHLHRCQAWAARLLPLLTPASLAQDWI